MKIYFPRFAASGSLLSLLALVAWCALPASARAQQPQAPPPTAPTTAASAPAAATLNDIRVVIHTEKGDIAATILASKAPMTSANFLNLVKRGFYDGLKFHRVEPGFVIQGGDPFGNGTGNAGYKFADEVTPGLVFDKAGVLAMANSGPNSNGSQFFITLGPAPHLNHRDNPPRQFNIFGRVTKGQEVATAIKVGDKITGIEVLDPTDALFAAQSAKLAEWNPILDKRLAQMQKARAAAAAASPTASPAGKP